MSRRFLRLFSYVLGFTLLMTACAPPSPTATPVPTRTPTAAPTITPLPSPTLPRVPRSTDADPKTRAAVRFLIAVPDAPLVDVYVESTLGAARLPFGQLTNAFPLNPDKYTIRVVLAGKNVADNAPLLSESLDLIPNESVIVAFTGTAQAFKLNRYPEDLSSVVGGQSRVLFVNLSTGIQTAQITLNSDALTTIERGAAPGSPQLVKSGTGALIVNVDSKAILSQNYLFQDRRSHVAFLLTDKNGKASLAFAASDTRREARLRVLNANTNPALKPFDVYLGDQRLAEKLEFRKATEYQKVGIGTATIRVLATGAAADSRPMYSQPINLGADQSVTFLLYQAPNPTYGQGGDQYILGGMVIQEDPRLLKAGTARLTVVNVAPQAPALLITEQNRAALPGFDSLKYGYASLGVVVKVRPLPLNFLIAPDNKTSAATPDVAALPAIEINPALDLQEGVSYVYVLTGRNTNNAPFIVSDQIGVEGGTSDSLVSVPVKLINAMTSVPSIDLYSGDKLVLKGVNMNTLSAVINVAFTAQAFHVTRSGSTAALASVDAFKAKDGTILLVALGTADKAYLLQNVERGNTPSESALVLLIHAAPTVPAVYLERGGSVIPGSSSGNQATPTPQSGTIYVNRLDYATISSPLALRTDVTALNVRSAKDGALIASLDSLTFEKGKRYNLLLVPGVAPNQVKLVLLNSK